VLGPHGFALIKQTNKQTNKQTIPGEKRMSPVEKKLVGGFAGCGLGLAVCGPVLLTAPPKKPPDF
jgi:hypothetical protein